MCFRIKVQLLYNFSWNVGTSRNLVCRHKVCFDNRKRDHKLSGRHHGVFTYKFKPNLVFLKTINGICSKFRYQVYCMNKRYFLAWSSKGIGMIFGQNSVIAEDFESFTFCCYVRCAILYWYNEIRWHAFAQKRRN